MKILSLARESAPSRGSSEARSSSRERTGLFTSGIVSTRQGQRIALFFTGRRHAGENFAQVLAHRAADCLHRFRCAMRCRASSRSCRTSGRSLSETVMRHSRRRFVDVVSNFPEECRYLLESLAEVYGRPGSRVSGENFGYAFLPEAHRRFQSIFCGRRANSRPVEPPGSEHLVNLIVFAGKCLAGDAGETRVTR